MNINIIIYEDINLNVNRNKYKHKYRYIIKNHIKTHLQLRHVALLLGAHCFFSAITAPPGTHAHPENLGRDDHENALEAQNEAVENSQLSLRSRW